MPKLYACIEIDLDFGPIQAVVNHEQRPLKPHEIHRFIEKSRRSEFTLAASIQDKEESRTAVGFDLTLNRQKHPAVFEWIIDYNSGIAHIKAHGEFESSLLRPGVSDYIRELGDTADLRLKAFNLRNGKWQGFEALIAEEKGARLHDQMYIKNWIIK
jgi:hypothetical protein